MHNTIDTARKLELEILNNKLEERYIFDINIAPPPAGWKGGVYRAALIESDYDRVYSIDHQGKRYYAQLQDYLEVRFNHLSHVFTMLATGKDLITWMNDWLQIHPKHDINTMMGIYLYKKIEVE